MKQFNKVRTAITLDPEVHEFVVALAEKEDRSFSSQLNKIVKDYRKLVEEKEGK